MMTVTSLPLRAASTSALTTAESEPERYSVCLIASTSGSRAAWRMKSATGVNAWKGWCSTMSFSRITLNRSVSGVSRCGLPGVNGGYLRSGRSIRS